MMLPSFLILSCGSTKVSPVDCLLVYWLRLLMLPIRGSFGDGSFLKGFSVSGLSVCWLRGKFGKLCKISDCLADTGVVFSHGLSSRVIISSVACNIYVWQKPVELLIFFLHFNWSLFWLLHLYTLVIIVFLFTVTCFQIKASHIKILSSHTNSHTNQI